MIDDAALVQRIARSFPSYRDFVDDALFHPAWGYYSTGKVRFGEGGHYDTFPLSLSPLFGRMLAEYAYRFWRRAGRPRRFEICELGGGNGQLCLDVVIWVSERARHEARWKRFAAALRYRIIERSPALIRRQQQTLGPLSDSVVWTNADLSQRAARGAPFGACGLVFANEVLDCLAHHRVISQPDRTPGVAFVIPLLNPGVRVPRSMGCVAGLDGATRAFPHRSLATVMADERLQPQVHFQEVTLPLRMIPRVHTFVHRHYPEFFTPARFRPYYACPEIEPLVRNAARLYRTSESLWIDYGDTWEFHLRTPEARRVFAGPPRSGATVYRDPGGDDITFLVDFSVVGAAAEAAGLRVKFYGAQKELMRRSGVQLDRAARDLIVRYRTLGWMLAVVGVGPEREWRHRGLTWSTRHGKGGRMRDDVNRAADEFVGKRPSNFRLMIVG